MADSSLTHYPNLTLRSGVYYLRMRVPLDLVSELGRTHVVRSLKTKERAIAVGRYRSEQARAERQFELARNQREALAGTRRLLASGKLERLAPAELESLAARWFEEAVQQVAQARSNALQNQSVDWEAVLEEVKATGAQLESPNPEESAPHVESVTGQILLAAGMPPEPMGRGKLQRRVRRPQVNRETAQYQQLAALVRRGLIALNGQRFADLTGAEPISPGPLARRDVGSHVQPSRTLDDLIRAFETDPSRAGRVEKTAVAYVMAFAALREVIGGSTAISSITREDVRRVQSLFLALPPNATKRFPGKTLRQVAELAAGSHLQPLRTKTVNEHVTKMATLFGWACREGSLEHFRFSLVRILRL